MDRFAVQIHRLVRGCLKLARKMTISMYLDGAKFWWGYLGIRSNPSLYSQLTCPSCHAVICDRVHAFHHTGANFKRQNTKYFYILWDGVTNETDLDSISSSLGEGADLTFLVVGNWLPAAQKGYKAQSLYPDGPIQYHAQRIHFDARTKALLLTVKIRNALMPLKNLLSNKGATSQMLDLAWGRRKIVFCGSYGTIPAVMQQFCARHGVDFSIFSGYEYYCNESSRSMERFHEYLKRNGRFLARLYDLTEIPATFFLSAIHFLGREYFIEKIRDTGHSNFINSYGSGRNVNVYTTPFYSQHTFIDFGSAAGPGNYPRLADLVYFKKKVVRIRLDGELEELLALASAGTLATHFEREWKRKAAELSQ